MCKRNGFTKEELELIHVACMMYGNELLDISKSSAPTESVSKSLKDRAEELWKLGEKVKVHMEVVYRADNKDND